jgi:hypothetical protein|eukprot:COSAG01_NODE_11104_length_2007_cov_1.862159_2_plen_171_part_00
MQMAENILRRQYGLSRPSWVDPAFYPLVLFPNSTEAPPSPPLPPGPAASCPKPTFMDNGTTVCFEATDAMSCFGDMQCPTAGHAFTAVVFASIGSPTGGCQHFVASPACHGSPVGAAVAVVARLCVGKQSCKVPANTDVLSPGNPEICTGVVKRTAVQLTCGSKASGGFA